MIAGTRNHRGDRVYRCAPESRNGRPGPHVAVRAEAIDQHVEAVMVAWLSQPGLADVISPPSHADTGALSREAQSIRGNLDDLAGDWAVGVLSKTQMRAATERGNARLKEIAAEIAAAAGGGPLAAFTGGTERAAAVWDGLDLSRRRAVIRAATEAVTLHPAGRGVRTLDLARIVGVSWVAE